MFFVILLFLSALSLSTLAAYYAIVGLVAIFAAAAVPVAVMGAALEVAKLVLASWLYRNWNNAPMLLRYYFAAAVLVLMMITSLGIFGYLSRAHIDQTAGAVEAQARVAVYDQKIAVARQDVDALRRQLTQLDDLVEQALSRSTTEQGAARAMSMRVSQQRDRSSLTRAIEDRQTFIAALIQESEPLRTSLRKMEAEVGPLKYAAQLIYGEEANNHLESAVKLMIVVLVLVFDPLAVLMLIAANHSLGRLAPPAPRNPEPEAGPSAPSPRRAIESL